MADVACRHATPIAPLFLLRLRRGQPPNTFSQMVVAEESGSASLYRSRKTHAGPLRGNVMHSPNLIAQTVLRLAAQTNTEGSQL